ncbi:Protein NONRESPONDING TO OXYLIPINS 2, mitochondrial, partial [Linum perenne]
LILPNLHKRYNLSIHFQSFLNLPIFLLCIRISPMASFGAKFISRSSLSSIKSALRSNSSKSAFSRSAPSSSASSPAPSIRRFSISRMPSELGCAASLLPFHSAVASARLTSCLSTTSRSCRALSQGTLCCTSPSL